MWSGSALQTTFMDSSHLEATITQQTFNSFGGSVGSSAQISVRTLGSGGVSGCPHGGDATAIGVGGYQRGFLQSKQKQNEPFTSVLNAGYLRYTTLTRISIKT